MNLRLSENDRAAGPSRSKKPSAPKTKPRKAAAKPSRKGSGGGGKRGRGKSARRPGVLSAFARLGGRMAYWGAVLGVWAIVAFGVVLGFYAAYLPPASEWEVPKRPPNVKIVSAGGTLIGNRGDTGGEAVRLEHLPPYVPEALISIEDRRYYYHFGVDVIGLTRAMVKNITSGRLVEGGSTLSQQLAKNLFLKPDRTIKRKMQEVVLALWLEKNYSKDEIIELYLNRVYFGAGAYGIDAAARTYYNKSARALTIAEAAVLAGVLKAPSYYSPKRNPDKAEARAQTVLMAMNREGYITEQEAANALSSPAAISAAHRRRGSENYVADYAMAEVKRLLGDLPGDLVVDTTLDMDMQKAGEDAIRQAISKNGKEKGVSQGALVALDGNGGVKAMVGGYDYGASQYNRVAQAHRQPGSAFKPFVYLTALEHGFKPSTRRLDGRVNIGGWKPVNYNGKYAGSVTIEHALAKSINTVAATTAHTVGAGNVVKTAQRLGIASKLRAHPSIALGTSEVTPLEITAAYVPFSNGGYGVLPHIVRRITTSSGKVLYQRDGSGPGKVIDSTRIGQMNRMMAEVLKSGTGKNASLGSRPAAGKTGTSQEFRDAWFIGYTGHLTAGVWFGNDDGTKTTRVTGGSLPAQAWRGFMTIAHEGLPHAALPGAEILTATASPAPASDPDMAPARGSAEQSPALKPPKGKIPGFLKRIFGGG